MALEIVKDAILKGPAAMSMLVKFIEALALAWGIGKSIPLVRVGLCEGSGIPSMRLGTERFQCVRLNATCLGAVS